MESSFQLMIAYDMFYYVKFTALSIKTICRALSLLVLKSFFGNITGSCSDMV